MKSASARSSPAGGAVWDSSLVPSSGQHRTVVAEGPSLWEGRVQSYSGYFHSVLYAEGRTWADVHMCDHHEAPSGPLPVTALKRPLLRPLSLHSFHQLWNFV